MTARPTVIVGDPVQVAAALERARDDGRLLAVRDAAPLDHGRVRVVAEMAAQLPPAPRRAWLPPVLVSLVALCGAGLLVGAVLAVAAVVSAGVAWVTAHWPAIAAVLALLAGALVAACCGKGRVHCPGCPR